MDNATFKKATFVWIINNFRDTREFRSNSIIFSPVFEFQDCKCYLSLKYVLKSRISMLFFIKEPLQEKNINCSITVNPNFDHLTESLVYDDGAPVTGVELNIKGDTCYSNLVIICSLKCDTPDQVPRVSRAESRAEFRAVQTDSINVITEEENRKNEEFSSLDMKDTQTLKDGMKQLFTDSKDYDVTLCVKEKKFKAHRNVLRARSSVFAEIQDNEGTSDTINIDDCDPETFEVFLRYIYYGSTERLTPKNAMQVYYPAVKYDFPHLKDRCVSLMKSSLSADSVCDIIMMAKECNELQLLETASEFFTNHIQQILPTESWSKLIKDNFIHANHLLIKTMAMVIPKK